MRLAINFNIYIFRNLTNYLYIEILAQSFIFQPFFHCFSMFLFCYNFIFNYTRVIKKEGKDHLFTFVFVKTLLEEKLIFKRKTSIQALASDFLKYYWNILKNYV